MLKKAIIIILLLLFTVSISGCTTKTAPNGTFGEKSISINEITVSDNTTSNNYTFNGTKYYYVDGYLKNNNKYDAFNVKINAIAYDANGNVVASNNSAHFFSNSLPAKGIGEFYVEFPNQNSNIVRYDVKVISATSNL